MSGMVFAIFVAVLPRNISALNKAQDWVEGIVAIVGHCWDCASVSQLGLDLTEAFAMDDDHDYV